MIKTYFVDSFTTEPFKGNPAGVCLLEHDLSREKMRNIAAEFGFAETVFVKKMDRYFWPWAGTSEDPVTGGVQTFLAKYWSTRLDKTKMNAFHLQKLPNHTLLQIFVFFTIILTPHSSEIS